MATIETPAQGVDKPSINVESAVRTDDPFAGQLDSVQNGEKAASPPSGSPVDRRLSADEWDASKTPPSRFGQRKGSIYATAGTRDGRTDRNKERDKAFHETVKEYGSGLWGKRRKSSSKGSDAVEKKTDGEIEKK